MTRPTANEERAQVRAAFAAAAVDPDGLPTFRPEEIEAMREGRCLDCGYSFETIHSPDGLCNSCLARRVNDA